MIWVGEERGDEVSEIVDAGEAKKTEEGTFFDEGVDACVGDEGTMRGVEDHELGAVGGDPFEREIGKEGVGKIEFMDLGGFLGRDVEERWIGEKRVGEIEDGGHGSRGEELGPLCVSCCGSGFEFKGVFLGRCPRFLLEKGVDCLEIGFGFIDLILRGRKGMFLIGIEMEIVKFCGGIGANEFVGVVERAEL